MVFFKILECSLTRFLKKRSEYVPRTWINKTNEGPGLRPEMVLPVKEKTGAGQTKCCWKKVIDNIRIYDYNF